MRRLLAVAIVSIALVARPAFAQPNHRFFESVPPARGVQVMVPRGMAVAAPENTARAIEMCVQDYCEWAAIDVRLTKDGRHVILHDETVDRTTNGHGASADLTLDELQKLDAGSWFAKRFVGTRLLSLPEALRLAKGKINVRLNCSRVDPELLAKEITAADLQHQVIVSADPGVLSKVKAASRGVVACLVKYHPDGLSAEELIRQFSPAAVELEADNVNASVCQQFHTAGIKVLADVCGEKSDNPKSWEQVIVAGADWVQTDDPAGVLFLSAHRRLGTFPVKISAHRGANRYAPENTVMSIREAARIGVDFAEIDIRTTRDGKLVLLHDGSLNRTTTGKGPVRQASFAEATALSAGAWFGKPFRSECVPAFGDALTALGDKLGVYLDSKDIAPEALIAAIHRHRLEDRHVVYQSAQYCDKLRKIDSGVRTLPPLGRLEQVDAVAAIKPYGVDAEWTILSKEVIAKCHERGIKVFSDALGRHESLDQYRKAMDWGIDCIQTDYPLRVLRAIELRSAANKSD
jgi:glycerophosphoryl diester phosphodiesterase